MKFVNIFSTKKNFKENFKFLVQKSVSSENLGHFKLFFSTKEQFKKVFLKIF